MAPTNEGIVPDYPTIFKHMALAIYLKGKLKGFPPKKFNAALEIALAQLRKYGMVRSDSTLARIELTSKGNQVNQKHLQEPKSRTKSKLFDTYYKSLRAEGDKAPPDVRTVVNAVKPAAKPKEAPLGPKLQPANRPDTPKTPARTSPKPNPVTPKKPNTAPRVPRARRVAKVTRARRA